MKLLFQITYVLCGLLLFSHCNKEESTDLQWCDLAQPNSTTCTAGTELSLQQMRLLVIGSWTLRAVACGFCSTPDGCETVDPNNPPVVARFTNDGMLQTVNQNGDPVAGSYDILVVDNQPTLVTDVIGVFPRFFYICDGVVVDDDPRLADEAVPIFEKTN